MIRIIVSGSSFSKLSSRLILLRFTPRIPISLQQNETSPESSSKKSKPLSTAKQYKFFNHFTCNKPIGNKFQCCWRITNSFITYSLSFIFIREIYYKEIYYTKKGYKETTMSHIS